MYISKVSHKVDYPSNIEEFVVDITHALPYSSNIQRYRQDKQ